MTNNNSVYYSFDFVKWDIWRVKENPSKDPKNHEPHEGKKKEQRVRLITNNWVETQSKRVTERLAAPEYKSTLVVYCSTLSDLPIFSTITLCLGNHVKVTHLYFSSVLCESFPYFTAWRTGRFFPFPKLLELPSSKYFLLSIVKLRTKNDPPLLPSRLLNNHLLDTLMKLSLD